MIFQIFNCKNRFFINQGIEFICSELLFGGLFVLKKLNKKKLIIIVIIVLVFILFIVGKVYDENQNTLTRQKLIERENQALIHESEITEQPKKVSVEDIKKEQEKKEEERNKKHQEDIKKSEYEKWNYERDDLKINIQKVSKNNNTMYVANIHLANPDKLCSEFAFDNHEKAISGKEKTSSIAARHNAIFAVNGDAFGFSPKRTLIRNGQIYNSASPSYLGYMAIRKDGLLKTYEKDITIDKMMKDGVKDVYSFGPVLVDKGKRTEVAVKSAIHPRTAIGQKSANDYIVIVWDGRQPGYSIGVDYPEMAQEFIDRGCKFAFNLDGGGSSTMYFKGRVINKPSDGAGERPISDILYIK